MKFHDDSQLQQFKRDAQDRAKSNALTWALHLTKHNRNGHIHKQFRASKWAGEGQYAVHKKPEWLTFSDIERLNGLLTPRVIDTQPCRRLFGRLYPHIAEKTERLEYIIPTQLGLLIFHGGWVQVTEDQFNKIASGEHYLSVLFDLKQQEVPEKLKRKPPDN